MSMIAYAHVDDGPGSLALGLVEYKTRAIHPRSGGQAVWSRYPLECKRYVPTPIHSDGFFGADPDHEHKLSALGASPQWLKKVTARVDCGRHERGALNDAATGGSPYDEAELNSEEQWTSEELQEEHVRVVERLRGMIEDISESTAKGKLSAMAELDQLLTRARHVFGNNHPNTQAMMSDLAALHSSFGDRSIAVALGRELFEVQKAVHGLRSPLALHALAALLKYSHATAARGDAFLAAAENEEADMTVHAKDVRGGKQPSGVATARKRAGASARATARSKGEGREEKAWHAELRKELLGQISTALIEAMAAPQEDAVARASLAAMQALVEAVGHRPGLGDARGKGADLASHLDTVMAAMVAVSPALRASRPKASTSQP